MTRERRGQAMEVSHDYFLCDGCKNKDFTRIHSFSIRFYGVNFSDELIYDKLTDELFQCTKCGKTFTKQQIEDVLAEFKKKRKRGTEE